MQARYDCKSDVMAACNHSNCHYPYFNEAYKCRLRKEFRQLSIAKRQMLFETTTQRIFIYFESRDDDRINKTIR